MNDINNLIESLVLSMPGLDPQPLRDSPPASVAQLDVLRWLDDHLGVQGLIAYEEWKEYSGSLPALRSLSEIDLTGFNESFVVDLLQDVDWSTCADPFMVQYGLPFLEHINSALQPHGLRLVDLLPFENAYILCVKDDEEGLARLDHCLAAFDIHIGLRAALDEKEVKAHVDALVTA